MRKIRVKSHIRVRNGKEFRVCHHMRKIRKLRRQTPIERSLRISQARSEGKFAKSLAKKMFEKENFQVMDISSATFGAGDLLVIDDNEKKFLVEVKKINEWETISLSSRRHGRIQINRMEHYDLLRNAEGLNATPLYLIFIKYENGAMLPKYISPAIISKYIKNKQYSDVKIPYQMIETEAFQFEKIQKNRY